MIWGILTIAASIIGIGSVLAICLMFGAQFGDACERHYGLPRHD